MCILTYRQYSCGHLSAVPSIQECNRTMKSIFCELRDIIRIDEECPTCIVQEEQKNKVGAAKLTSSESRSRSKSPTLLAASSVNKITSTGVIRDGKASIGQHKYDVSYKFKPLCRCRNMDPYGPFGRKPMPSLCRNVPIRGASPLSLEARERRHYGSFSNEDENESSSEEEGEKRDGEEYDDDDDNQVYMFSWDEGSLGEEKKCNDEDDDEDAPLPMTLVFRCATASNILGKDKELKKPELTVTTKQVSEPKREMSKLIETPDEVTNVPFSERRR
ncbi:uncharacterized protein SAPINGB_P003534 [Magnusiomyces paraingens]|uniref:Uncharacterized protein n=1 Tax=Magnusiomyces paraingens TaxID=2606893 RepID=A0A5E8BS48_9ASCO|nr:uncharacterized protein SAPINGB_P003534 [Saprochaete ingens]VVT53359.1 unnamed protein product [Saprochaete ingens]